MSSFAVYPSLKGRSVLVTGGGSGIGAQIVRRFCEQGSKVAFIDVDRAASEALVAGDRGAATGRHRSSCPATCATSRPCARAVAEAAAANGPITVLVNNAARDDRHAWDTVTPEFWDERFAVNLRHQFFAAQAVQPMMKEAGGGSIINMGSTSLDGGPGRHGGLHGREVGGAGPHPQPGARLGAGQHPGQLASPPAGS